MARGSYRKFSSFEEMCESGWMDDPRTPWPARVRLGSALFLWMRTGPSTPDNDRRWHNVPKMIANVYVLTWPEAEWARCDIDPGLL